MVGADRGKTFIRTLRSLAIAKGDPLGATAFAQGQGWSNAGLVIESIKAVVSSLGRDDPAYGYSPAAFDFAEMLRPLAVVSRLNGIRRAPARVRMISAIGGTTAYFSGERNARAISKMAFQASTLEQLSVIAMSVATDELLVSSSPSAEAILSRDIVAAAVAALDTAFLDPTNAGIAGIKPSAISFGTTAIHSSGSTLAAIDNDLELLINALAAAGSTLEWAQFIVRPRSALYLSLLRGSGGALAHPGMTVRGGVLAGLPCLVSAASHSDAGSPTLGGEITLVDASQILLTDDGGGAVEASNEASILMTDNPTMPAQLTSMWQTHAVALRASRFINWAQMRPGMAQLLDQVTY